MVGIKVEQQGCEGARDVGSHGGEPHVAQGELPGDPIDEVKGNRKYDGDQ